MTVEHMELEITRQLSVSTQVEHFRCTIVRPPQGARSSRNWFRDRPDLTGETVIGRIDSPSSVGARKGRVGE